MNILARRRERLDPYARALTLQRAARVRRVVARAAVVARECGLDHAAAQAFWYAQDINAPALRHGPAEIVPFPETRR